MSQTRPDALAAFSAPVRAWFEQALGSPTPPQAQGWSAIQRGEHTLILAPTGSGKTLAAFLWGIDRLCQECGSMGVWGCGRPVSSSSGRAGSTHSESPAVVPPPCRRPTTTGALDASASPSPHSHTPTPPHSRTAGTRPGVSILYVSPLKALNNDVERNLRVPLEGIRETAEAMGLELPEIRVAVRSGDTPQKERQAMVRRPPDILITTPESLYLILTSPTARGIFRQVHTVIIDEIHTLVGTKRGVHLALSLERLQHLAAGPIQRIGLSATIRPLDEAARFLGGGQEDYGTTGPRDHGTTETTDHRPQTTDHRPQTIDHRPETAENENENENGRPTTTQPHHPTTSPPPISSISPFPSFPRAEDENGNRGEGHPLTPSPPHPFTPSGPLVPRPVVAVDAHYHKDLDLQVLSPIADHRGLPGGSIWPSLIPHVAELIEGHRSTLVFCNSRRMAERTADRLNEEGAAREQRGHALALLADGVARGVGMFAAGDGTVANPIRAHHGSISREARLEMERALKAGELPALVATASLELGIDIGAVDLVIQLQAPEGVARGLQRVGRSGHLVGQTSKARVFPTHAEDLLAAAAVAGGMLKGEVETTTCPRNCLDVLAQQIVAMVSIETWNVDALYGVVCRAYPYRDLPRPVFDSVLEMLSGRYPTEASRELRARLSWDRVNSAVAALPGSRSLALSNGGTIPDSGTFATILSDGETKLGELDEEFVYETRIGDTFMLGSQVWRVTRITDDKVSVVPAPGVIPRMPFWKGDAPWRPYELGLRVGEFRRRVADRLRGLDGPWRTQPETPDAWQEPTVAGILEWLRSGYALDDNSARSVVSYVARQLQAAGAISSDRCVVVESFRDAMGDPRVVIHSPFGGRVNGPWSLALREALRERLGVEPEVQSNDDGILLRFPETDAEFPVDLVARMAPAEARERVLRELPNSAVFGAQFRQNAARAVLLPGGRPGKRTPFWLQRLRARELLEGVRRFPDFPILIETYRDCLQDVMDLPHLEEVLQGIREGRISVVAYEAAAPSPVAQSLLAQFMSIYMYEGDAPKAETQLQQLAVDRSLLGDVLKDVALDEILKPEAIDAVARQLQHTETGFRARTAEELAVLLEQLGDLAPVEIEARSHADPAPWVHLLAGSGRIVSLPLPTASGPEPRWVHSLYAGEYALAFDLGEPDEEAQDAARFAILRRYLAHCGPVTVDAIRTRYAFPEEWLRGALGTLIAEGVLARGRFTRATPSPEQFIDRRNLEEVHRRTLSLLRREVRPVPHHVYADFLARWQHVHPTTRLRGREGLLQALQQLRGLPLAGPVWERDILPARVDAFSPQDLDALCADGEVLWVALAQADPKRARVSFCFRGEGRVCLPEAAAVEGLSPEARAIHDFLKSEGTAFEGDIRSLLGLPAQAVERTLVELAVAGLATSDSLIPLRRILQPPDGAMTPAEPERRWRSSLESQLPLRAPDPTSRRSRRPSRTDYQAAKRRVSERLRQESQPDAPGRWGLVNRLSILGRELPPEERAALQARLLLQRWGVLSRAMVDAEEGSWEWEGIAAHLRLMEMRGEVRRGLFVEGMPGLQYGLPEAVERLRECRDAGGQEEAPVVLNACDPASLYGSAGNPLSAAGIPLTFARVPSTYLALRRGQPVVVAESSGAAITTMQEVEGEPIRQAVDALFRHILLHRRRVIIETWNGQPVLETDAAALLASLGFYRDPRGMVGESGRA